MRPRKWGLSVVVRQYYSDYSGSLLANIKWNFQINVATNAANPILLTIPNPGKFYTADTKFCYFHSFELEVQMICLSYSTTDSKWCIRVFKMPIIYSDCYCCLCTIFKSITVCYTLLLDVQSIIQSVEWKLTATHTHTYTFKHPCKEKETVWSGVCKGNVCIKFARNSISFSKEGIHTEQFETNFFLHSPIYVTIV